MRQTLRTYCDGTTETGIGLPTVGALAYWDSLTAGPVPCRVESVGDPNDYGIREVIIRLTAAQGVYKRGELVTVLPRHVIPRSALFTRDGFYRIRAYTWPSG